MAQRRRPQKRSKYLSKPRPEFIAETMKAVSEANDEESLYAFHEETIPEVRELVSVKLAQCWADIARPYHETVVDSAQATIGAMIDAGQILQRAKDRQKSFGNAWLRMFDDHKNPVPYPLACGKRTAQRYMKMARNELLANPANWEHFPIARSALDEVARGALSAVSLQELIASGRINP